MAFAVIAVACSPFGSDDASDPDGSFPGATDEHQAGSALTRIAAPAEFASSNLSALPGAGPTGLPLQVSERLAGTALPTNQWWTSALIGPGTERLWALPLVADVEPDHVTIGRPLVEASADVIRSTAVEAIRIHGASQAGGTPPATSTLVTGYGAFSVDLAVNYADGSAIALTLAQGSPATWVEVTAGRVSLAAGPGYVVESTGENLWELRGPHGHVWTVAGRLTQVDPTHLAADAGTLITLIARPEGAGAEWVDAERTLLNNPVVNTTSATSVLDDGAVAHELEWRRRSDGSAAIALLPHQQARAGALPPVAGSYATARGTMSVALVDRLTLTYPIGAFLPGVPAVLDAPARARVAAVVATELLAPSVDGGSYWDSKSLGRLATIAETADAVDRPDIATEARAVLAARLGDWFRNDGPTDQRRLVYEPNWGGVIAHPPEYGSENYNDHHFHYGYLIQAAATVAAADPGFLSEFGPIVDRLVDDLLGAPSSAFPPQRVFNPYLGHSLASGFSLFPDGNNQESSSEAVHAWWAVTRWASVRGDDGMADRGLARYVIEADSANRYWLGLGVERPVGYAHEVAGIVWGAKIDFATFFDPAPGSVIGIQLLPFSFGSLYRTDGAAATRRYAAVARSGVQPSGIVNRWPDLFLMDLALGDPAQALALFRANPSIQIEDGNSRAFLAYWLESLATLGRPDPTVSVNSPFGAAFAGLAGGTVLVGQNPTSTSIEVRFGRNGSTVGELTVEPGGTAVVLVDR